MRAHLPRILVVLMVAVLGILVFTACTTLPYIWMSGADSGIDGMTNQQQHAGIVREIDRNSGRLDNIEQTLARTERDSERLARLEVNLEVVGRMFWALLAGVVALVVDAVQRRIKGRA
jgi:hypothetical protein